MSSPVLSRAVVFVLVCALCVAPSAMQASVLNVPSTTYPTVQAAIDASVSGDTIVMADGVYTGSGNTNLSFHGKAIVLESQNGPGSCIIDCQGSGRGIAFESGEGPSSVLDGLTITNARMTGGFPVSYGGGLRCIESSPTIRNCIFSNNWTDHSGGAVGILGGSPTISGCLFTGNSALDGGAIVTHQYGSSIVPQVSITDSAFLNNSSRVAEGGGVFVGESDAYIGNCVFRGNSARTGGAVYHQGGTLQMVNCLITENLASQGGGGLGFGSNSESILNCTIANNTVDGSYAGGALGGGGVFCMAQAVFANCVLWGNSAALGPEISVFAWPSGSLASLTIAYSDVEGGQSAAYVVAGNLLNWGLGNIDAAPLFRDPPSADYHLLPGSPCVNTGDNASVPVSVDLDGSPRIEGGTVDMGAYELSIHPAVVYVDSYAPPGGDGQSWYTAFNCLQDALATASSGDEVRVAQGIYRPDQGAGITPGDHGAIFQLNGGVALRGGYFGLWMHSDPNLPEPNLPRDPNVPVADSRDPFTYQTVLSGDLNGDDGPDFSNCEENSQGVVYSFGVDSTAILDGFVVSGARIDGGMANDQGSCPTVVNCVFTKNYAEVGGAGMSNGAGSNPTLTNCSFSGNYASGLYPHYAGRAVYNSMSSPTLVDCTFTGNFGSEGDLINTDGSNAVLTRCTFNGSGYTLGGAVGMHNSASSPIVTDCAFSDYAGTGVVNDSGSNPTLTDCIFDRDSMGMYNDQSSPTLTRCMFSNNDTVGFLDANESGAMYNVSSSPILVDCAFTGNANGGICNVSSSPTLSHCTFTGNSAVFGGAVFNDWDSSPILIGCVFTGNSATGPGGATFDRGSSPVLTNCTFNGNSSGDAGGAMCCCGSSTLTLVNCTFVANPAPNGGAIDCGAPWPWLPGSSTVTLSNCILWDGGNEISNGDGSVITVSFSDVQGGWLGQGNIDVDPLFFDMAGSAEDSLRLMPDSPCIDAGDNSVVPAGVITDAGAYPRFVDNPAIPDTGSGSPPVVDMGAFEAPLFTATGTGSSVIVQPPDTTTGGTFVTLTFDQVTEPGCTAVVSTELSENQQPPPGFRLGDSPLVLDITTTATYSGEVELCIDYRALGSDANSLGLYHSSDGVNWQDITTFIDWQNQLIYGRTTSFSLLALFEEIAPANYTPQVHEVTAPIDPTQVTTPVGASAAFTDADAGDSHTGSWDWGDGSMSAGIVTEADGFGVVTGSHNYASAGVYTVKCTVTDSKGRSGRSVFHYVVIYDTTAGFVTGGGWISSPAGAYTPNPALTGKATFGFVAKYAKGTTVPTGQTEFQFKVASLKFHSTEYQWLVVAGAQAKYKGSGTINGGGDCGFILTAIDGQINGGGGADKFRVKIWDKATDAIVYDNQMGASDDDYAATVLGGGSITIHK